MNIKSFIRLITVASIVTIIAFISGIAALSYTLKQVQEASDNQLISLALSRETADNSLGLTANVRSYVVSGNQAFKDEYFRIIEVRAGNIPRPDTAAVSPGRQVPLDKLYDEAGFTAEEKGFLAKANELSGKLAELEVQAMNLVEQATPETLAAARERAAVLLHDQGYLGAAQAIQAPVKEFERKLEERVSANRLNALGLAWKTQIALLTMTILATIGIIWVIVWLRRRVLGTLGRLVESLTDGAQEVDGTSSQLAASSDSLANGASQNAASLEETSAALEELSSMTKRNAENAGEANALMSQANDYIRMSESSMSKVITAMNEISASGSQIGKIIKTIDEIAFQTNLLALNAAVEAARAGEAGAGFAVVADEVRNLAIRSADAAKNTSELIAATVSNIELGSEMVNTTAENFKNVEDQTEKVTKIMAEVTSASKEQSQGIGQITTAMNQMDKVTQVNAASAEESAGAAGQLATQAGNLLGAVSELTSLLTGKSDFYGSGSSDSPLKVASKPAARQLAAPARTPSQPVSDLRDMDGLDF